MLNPVINYSHIHWNNAFHIYPQFKESFLLVIMLKFQFSAFQAVIIIIECRVEKVRTGGRLTFFKCNTLSRLVILIRLCLCAPQHLLSLLSFFMSRSAGTMSTPPAETPQAFWVSLSPWKHRPRSSSESATQS